MKKNKVTIIAEVGVNHNGSITIAKKMIDTLSGIGVDFVKFQLYNTDDLVTDKAKKAKYQIKNSKNNNQFDMLKKYEINDKFLNNVIEYCKIKKTKFLCSVFDLQSFELIKRYNIKYIKIPSGEITNFPLLEAISKTNLKIFLSTGMCNIKEIKESLKVLNQKKIKNITLMHCTTDYPTSFNEVNLNVIKEFKTLFNTSLGYSDHTIGDEVAIAAVALGVTVVEKHFTLNNKFSGPDHSSSLEPNEFKIFVSKIRNIEKAFGSKTKKPTKSEKINLKFVRKSIYASKDIKKNELLTIKNITTKRPALGINPMNWNNVINTKAKKNYKKNQLIK